MSSWTCMSKMRSCVAKDMRVTRKRCRKGKKKKKFFAPHPASLFWRQERTLLHTRADVERLRTPSMTEKKRVAIVGSGNWGCAIAKIVGQNAQRHNHLEEEVRMWVFEEMVAGRKLTDIINTRHENVKYLPGKKLPGEFYFRLG